MQKQMYRALIVDDEPDARNVLRKLIGQFCPHLEVCAEAETVPDALAAIQQHRPAILFLDIDLRGGNGFEILDAFPRPEFKVVFITAHDDFAIKAFQYRALHYLLKPIDPQDLIAATNELQSPGKYWPEYELLRQTMNAPRSENLLLPTVQGTAILQADEVDYFIAEDKYAAAILANGEKIFVSLSLKAIGELLPAGEFIRPSQSYIVRIKAVRKLQKGDGISLLLKDKTEIHVSRQQKDEVLRVFAFGQ